MPDDGDDLPHARPAIDRGRPPHRDFALERARDTQPGVRGAAPPLPIDPEPTPIPVMVENVLHQIEARIQLNDRELHLRNVIVAAVSNVILQHVEHERAREPSVTRRLHELETFKRAEEQRWLRLAGGWQPSPAGPLTADPIGDGHLGDAFERIGDLREDIGPREVCREERGELKRMRGWRLAAMAATGSALLAIGGSVYAYLQFRDARTAAASRLEERVNRNTDLINRHLGIQGPP